MFSSGKPYLTENHFRYYLTCVCQFEFLAFLLLKFHKSLVIKSYSTTTTLGQKSHIILPVNFLLRVLPFPVRKTYEEFSTGKKVRALCAQQLSV